MISRVDSGNRRLAVRELGLLGRYLGVSVDELLFGGLRTRSCCGARVTPATGSAAGGEPTRAPLVTV